MYVVTFYYKTPAELQIRGPVGTMMEPALVGPEV